MIKKIRDFFLKTFRSLRYGMFLAIIFAIILSVLAGFLTNTLFKNWIEKKYNSEESKQARYENYVADLQSFVDEHELSSEDTSEILRWVESNRNIYLFIYKDNQLFFDSSIQPDNEDTSEKNEESNSNDENRGGSEDGFDSSREDDSSNAGDTGASEPDGENDENANSGGSDTESGGSTDKDNTGETENDDKENNKENDKESGKDSNSHTGGLTVQYPSREEIIDSAKNNGLLPLNLSDGSLLVSLADFTEYIYYDAANIVTLAVGVLILILVLMLYFQNIIVKISRLAKDVTNVYEVDMNNPIRTQRGSDELSILTRNVEEMRSSMMESLKNEKEAINANTELITSMSHDIRTPLTVLLGYIDIMKNSTKDENMQDYIRASEVTAMRLKELSDDMFRYFLVFGGGEIEVDMADYGAKTLFQQIFSEHVLLLTEKDYNIEFTITDEINDSMRVLTDAPKLMRVVDNLFSNIYKYADKEKNVVIDISSCSGKLSIHLENAILQNADKAESNGVGLRTCKKLCEALNIEFEMKIKAKDGFESFSTDLYVPMVTKKETV